MNLQIEATLKALRDEIARLKQTQEAMDREMHGLVSYLVDRGVIRMNDLAAMAEEQLKEAIKEAFAPSAVINDDTLN